MRDVVVAICILLGILGFLAAVTLTPSGSDECGKACAATGAKMRLYEAGKCECQP